MKITNKLKLPELIVRAMQNDPYYRGDGTDYTASELIAPVKLTILKHRHWDKLEEDAVDGTWKLMGKSMHYILEQAGLKNALQEERLCVSLLGKKVAGQFDFYCDEILYDLKVTSVWSAVHGSRWEEWTKQLNIYAYLLRKAGFTVNAVKVVVVYRDWSVNEHDRDSSGKYPEHAIEEKELSLWSEKMQLDFIKGRLQELIIAENDPDEALKACTDEEQWRSEDVFAVMKEGNKKSTKNFTNAHEAEVFAKEKGKGFSVEHRVGEPKRCLNYCPVKEFCHQYKMEVGEVPA